jgi:hypothetical protein
MRGWRSRKSKYGALPTMVDGIKFASKREAKRYGELKLLQQIGEIRDLKLQPKFPIYAMSPDGKLVQVAIYRADFSYEPIGDGYPAHRQWSVVEDVKGVRTDVYRLKKRMVEAQYGIQIREI